MSNKLPDVRKLKKKRRVADLVDALRATDVRTKVEAASALGEIGDWANADSLWQVARELSEAAARRGDWDPVAAARPLLRSWAQGAARNPDKALRAEGARVLAEIELQEEQRLSVLLGTLEVHDAALAMPVLTSSRDSSSGDGLPGATQTTTASPDQEFSQPVPPERAESPPDVQTGSPSEPTSAPATVATVATPRVPTSSVLQGHEAEITELHLAADGRRLFSAAWDGTVRMWDLGEGRCLNVLHSYRPGCVILRLTSDGHRLVSTSPEGSLRVWDANDGKRLHTLEGHADSVTCLALTPDGHTAVSGSADATLRTWDLDTGASHLRLSGHTAPVTVAHVVRDGRWLVSGSTDTTVRVWDLSDGSLLRVLGGHPAERLVGVIPERTLALTYGRSSLPMADEGTWRVWDVETGSILRAYREGDRVRPSVTAALAPQGDVVVLADPRNGLVFWRWSSEEALASDEQHENEVVAFAVSQDGRLVFSGAVDSSIRVWDPATAECLAVLEGHRSIVTALAVTPDNRFLISGSSDATLRIWDLGFLGQAG